MYKKSFFRRFFGCFTSNKGMPELELIFKDEPSVDVMSDPTELYADPSSPGYVPPDILEPRSFPVVYSINPLHTAEAKLCNPEATETTETTGTIENPDVSQDEPLLNPESSDDEPPTKTSDMSHYYMMVYFVVTIIMMTLVNGR